jgi:hypothetical protein
MGVILAVFGAAFLAAVAIPIVAWSQASAGSNIWDVILFAVCGAFFVWLAICQFRRGVRVTSEKLTITNEYWMRVVAASSIRKITLKPHVLAHREHWIPWVELTSGRGVWIDNFDCGLAGRPPRPELVAVVEEVRALLRVASDDLARSETDAGNRNSMTAYLTDQADLSSLKDPRYSKPPQDDLVPSQMQACEPELDAHGLPVQNQPAKGPAIPMAISWLIAIACPILGAVSAGIAITYQVSHHKLAGHLSGLCIAAGLTAGILVFFLLPLWWGKVEKSRYKAVIGGIVIVGGFLGVIGLFTLTGPGNGN